MIVLTSIQQTSSFKGRVLTILGFANDAVFVTNINPAVVAQMQP